MHSHHLTDGFDEKQLEVLYKNGDHSKWCESSQAKLKREITVIIPLSILSSFVKSTLDIKDAHEIATRVEDTLMKKHAVF